MDSDLRAQAISFVPHTAKAIPEEHKEESVISYDKFYFEKIREKAVLHQAKSIKIFWDFDNVPLQYKYTEETYELFFNDLLLFISTFGTIEKFNIYKNKLKHVDISEELKKTIEKMNFNLIEVSPHTLAKTEKQVMDNIIIADMIEYSVQKKAEKKHSGIVLITGDGDFKHSLQSLENKYQTDIINIFGFNNRSVILVIFKSFRLQDIVKSSIFNNIENEELITQNHNNIIIQKAKKEDEKNNFMNDTFIILYLNTLYEVQKQRYSIAKEKERYKGNEIYHYWVSGGIFYALLHKKDFMKTIMSNSSQSKDTPMSKIEKNNIKQLLNELKIYLIKNKFIQIGRKSKETQLVEVYKNNQDDHTIKYEPQEYIMFHENGIKILGLKK